jgi:multiple sugar transport system permease protein
MSKARTALVMISAAGLALFLLAPFYWVIVTSFMPEYEVISVPPHWLPEVPTAGNYAYFVEAALGHPPSTEPGGPPVGLSGPAVASNSRAQVAHEVGALPKAMLNSIVISMTVVAANLLLGVPAAYAFVRLRFRGSTPLLLLYLTSRMLPSIALLIPIYALFARLRLLDTIVAPAIADITLTLPFTIWILKSYLQTIPQELEDAARVDRCTRFQAVWRVVLPVAVPGLVAASMFAFMSSWGEFLLSSTLTTAASAPITVAISNLATNDNIQRTLISSGTIISLIPPVLLAIAFQRVIVQGLVSGAVKG